jgi:fructosamine-3-kinase
MSRNQDHTVEESIKVIFEKSGLEVRTVQPLSGGQVNRVYLVNDAYVLRIGSREDAFQRLKNETELLQHLAGRLPVPKIIAFGELDGMAYQIQHFIQGQKLHAAWKSLPAGEKDNIVVEISSALKTLHKVNVTKYAASRIDSQPPGSWKEFFTAKFMRTLDEIKTLRIPVPPDLMEMAKDYFTEYGHALEGGAIGLVHGDLWLGNILIDRGKIAAILDFEYALQAPLDYELLKIEDFCLYPNDYAEEDDEIYSAADFADFCVLLRGHYPESFTVPLLRERLNLYHLESTFSDYLAWRKDNRATIPFEQPNAMNFVKARITNFVFGNGVRMF